MIPFNRDYLRTLMEARKNPSISIYLPVQRVGAETRQGPVRLRALLKRAEEILRKQNWRQPLIEKLISPMTALQDQALFWEHQQEGLALFADENALDTQLLPVSVEETLLVADRFYTRPLLAVLAQDVEYYLLALSLNEVKVFRGSRQQLDPMPVTGLSGSLQDVLSTYSLERHLQQHGGTVAGSSGGRVFHGYENIKDVEKTRIEEYLRGVDASLRQELSDGLPLVVACVDYLFSIFRQVSKYVPLLEKHVSGSPDSLSPDALAGLAWPIIQPLAEQNRDRAWQEGQNLLGSARIAGNVRQILAAAQQGRVANLFMPSGHVIPGRYDMARQSAVRLPDARTTDGDEAEDLLDIAATQVFLRGGSVYETDPASIPPGMDAFAILRY